MPAITPMDASMWKVSGYINETDPAKLEGQLTQMLRASGFSILGDVEHHFDPAGYTSLILLGESHLAIHTFPEVGYTYFELSSCIEEKYKQFRETLTKELGDGLKIVSEESVSPHP